MPYLEYVIHDLVLVAWPLIGEGRTPHRKFEGEDCYLPDIAALIIPLEGVVLLVGTPTRNDLGSDVIDGSTERGTSVVLIDVANATEVTEFYLAIRDENVLGL